MPAVTSCPSSLLAGTKSVAARSVSSVMRFETRPHNAVWSFIRVLSFGLIEIPRADTDYPSQQLNSLELSPSDRYLSIGFFPENIHYCYYSGRASLCLQPCRGHRKQSGCEKLRSFISFRPQGLTSGPASGLR